WVRLPLAFLLPVRLPAASKKLVERALSASTVTEARLSASNRYCVRLPLGSRVPVRLLAASKKPVERLFRASTVTDIRLSASKRCAQGVRIVVARANCRARLSGQDVDIPRRMAGRAERDRRLLRAVERQLQRDRRRHRAVRIARVNGLDNRLII